MDFQLSHRDYFIMGSRYVRRVCAISVVFIVANVPLCRSYKKSFGQITQMCYHLENREVKHLNVYTCSLRVSVELQVCLQVLIQSGLFVIVAHVHVFVKQSDSTRSAYSHYNVRKQCERLQLGEHIFCLLKIK